MGLESKVGRTLARRWIPAAAGLVLSFLPSKSESSYRFLEVRALKGDSYSRIAHDLTDGRGIELMKKINGKLKEGMVVRIPYEKLSSKVRGGYEKVVLGRDYPSLWSVSSKVMEYEDIWAGVRVLQRINSITDYRDIPKGTALKVPSGEEEPKLEEIISKDYITKGYSRVPNFKRFPPYLRRRLRKEGIFKEQLMKRDIDMIVIHTTEHGDGDLGSLLKYVRRRRACHYLIGKDGVVYQIVREKDRANGAGQSLWKGIYDLDYNAINIEIFANNRSEDRITKEQYDSLRVLIRELRNKYGIGVERVLGHNQIAISYRYMARQRKGDPGKDFDWGRAGLDNNYLLLDPDILNGIARLNKDGRERVLVGQIRAAKKRAYAAR